MRTIMTTDKPALQALCPLTFARYRRINETDEKRIGKLAASK